MNLVHPSFNKIQKQKTKQEKKKGRKTKKMQAHKRIQSYFINSSNNVLDGQSIHIKYIFSSQRQSKQQGFCH